MLTNKVSHKNIEMFLLANCKDFFKVPDNSLLL